MEDMYGERKAPPAPDGLPTHTLSVLGLSYIVKAYEGSWWKGCCCRPRYQKAVLRNISLHLESAELTAILGNSGSGKTSLLDVISCRGEGTVVGGVYMDNALVDEAMFQREAGYVLQTDNLLPNLTVHETLTYTSVLKFPNTTDRTVQESRVQDVMEEIGLRHVSNSRIGGTINRGISGGEKRRLSIALQLLQDPKILLLDEPTTGLDSFTAHRLVQQLGELAKKKNKIIAMTIHQPRSDIFKLLDNVCMLSTGEVVYSGPATQLVPYFSNLGHICPTYANPLDTYLDLVSIDHRSAHDEEASHFLVNDLKSAYVHSSLFRNTLAGIHGSTRKVEGPQGELIASTIHLPPPPKSFWFIFFTLLRRMTLNLYRDRSGFVTRLFQMCVLSFFLWVFLIDLQDNQESIQDRNGLFYQAVSGPPYVGLLNCVALYPQLRTLYYREARDGLYDSLVFLLAYFVHILPFQIFSSVLFSTIIYWGLGLNPAPGRFGIFTAVVFMMHYLGEVLAIIFMGIFRQESVVNSVTALVLAIAGLVSSGFVRSTVNMLDFLKTIGLVNVFKYASEILVANEFQGMEFTCRNESSYPCLVTSGDRYISLFYPDSVENIGRNFGCLSGFFLGLILVALITYRVMGVRHLH